MSEQFILGYIPLRLKQLGYSNWFIRYRDLGLPGFGRLTLEAYNELFYIVGDPEGVTIESDYGLYARGGNFFNANLIKENIHEHRGVIRIENLGDEDARLRLVQVIIVN